MSVRGRGDRLRRTRARRSSCQLRRQTPVVAHFKEQAHSQAESFLPSLSKSTSIGRVVWTRDSSTSDLLCKVRGHCFFAFNSPSLVVSFRAIWLGPGVAVTWLVSLSSRVVVRK